MNPSYQGGSVSSPVHYYLDDTPYFITAATYQHQRLLNDELKNQLQGLLHQVYAEYRWQLHAWVILDDHYHLLATSRVGRDVTKIIGKTHNQMAQAINAIYPPSQREQEQVWWNYWDYCPRGEKDYNIRLCYLLNNPYKHGYVERLQEWPWSSFHQLFEEQGEGVLRGLFREHRAYRDLRLAEDGD
jgi:putative transposase